MPLKSGTGRTILSSNIREIINSYKQKGTIGASTPKSPEAARKQAVAIAFSKARKSMGIE